MINGVIFDADGTLLDSMEIWDRLPAEFLESLGKVPEKNLNVILSNKTFEEGVVYLKKRYALSLSEKEIRKALLKALETFYADEVQLKKGVKDFLLSLKEAGIPSLVVTTGKRENVEKALLRCGVRHLTGRILSTGDVNMSKRTPEIYFLCAEMLGTRPSETAVFEDAFYAVSAAKQGKFVVVGVFDSKEDFGKVRETADESIRNFEEIRIKEKKLCIQQ